MGDFKDGMRHGKRTSKYTNGNKYKGEWKNNKNHGKGTLNNASGNRYVGGFNEVKFHSRRKSSTAMENHTKVSLRTAWHMREKFVTARSTEKVL